MKKRFISIILAAIMAIFVLPSMAEELQLREEIIYPTYYAFAGKQAAIAANENRALINTSIVTREGNNNVKLNFFDSNRNIYLYTMYYYPSFEIPDCYAVSDIKLTVTNDSGNAGTATKIGYLVDDKFVLEGIEAGEYYESDYKDIYDTVRGLYSGDGNVMSALTSYTYNSENKIVSLNIGDKIISELISKEEEGTTAVLNLGLWGNSAVYIKPSQVYLTVTYDNEKILKKELAQLETAEDIAAFYVKYNDNIGVNLDFFEDMSDVYSQIFEWFKDASEEEYTFEGFKNVFDKTVKNLVVEKSKVEISDFADGEVEITSEGYMYMFDNEYTSEASFSTYVAFDIKDTGNRFLFTAGGVTIMMGSGEMILSDGNSEAACDISDDFCGTVVLKFITGGKIIAVAANSQERNIIEIDVDSFYVQTISFESDNNAKVSDFILQQYPDDFEKSATEALDAVSGLLDEGKRDEAIEAYDSAANIVHEMADGIVKKELSLYSEILLARVNYAKEQAKYENAVTAFDNSLITKKYEDYLKAEDIASSITDPELAESIKVKVSEAQTEFAQIVPVITSVMIEGSWKTGKTLAAKVIMEDSCGNGDGYECVWLVNGNDSNQKGKEFKVLSSHAGKKIVLRVIPKNKQGTKGNPKDSLAATIENISSGGSGGSGGGIRVSVSSSVTVPPTEPTKTQEPQKEETKKQSFKDISGHWAESTINNMMEKNIINGISNDEFAPERNITKAEFVTMVLRALNKKTNKYNGEFKDVSASDWYADTLSTAYEMGLVNGSDGIFNPQKNILRQEMAKILVVAYEIKNGEINAEEDAGCTDFSDISEWAKEFINKAFAAGLMKGDDGGRFNPLSSATRAEAATAVERFINK